MSASKMAKIAVLCVLFCFMIGLVVDQAFAQKSSPDKSLASKKGMEALDAGPKKTSDAPGSTTLQKTMGFGSIVVMIAVVKWL